MCDGARLSMSRCIPAWLVLTCVVVLLGPSLQQREKFLSLLKRRRDARSLGVLHVGGGLALLAANARGPSPDPEPTGPGLAPRLARGGRVHRTPAGGGGPSPRTEASAPGADPQGGGKGRGPGTEAGAPGPDRQIADAGLGPGAAGGGRCFGVVLSIGGTDGRGSLATLQFSFSENSGALDPGRGEVQARRLRGSLNWVNWPFNCDQKGMNVFLLSVL